MARVYSLTKQEALANNDVVSGTIPIFSTFARVLFDSGVSHSFIATQFVRKKGLPCDALEHEMYVSTPGDIILISNKYCKCKINIVDMELLVELIILNMHDYDIILGMNWLSRNHASILHLEKMVVFRIPDQSEFCFEGSKVQKPMHIILALQAHLMLRSGCTSFLASVKDLS
ncbi:uncharacterized protein LOC109847538 [Asparagus officinalis]|uniref:uncharacterized protein LOC109847538 n=1 Tax=Asparagus officinalis TaxID=4686 RepID=UPI00098E4189|nr:uncharacterized protein LOC109847538 [Asparagus officinalis]